MRVPHTNGMRDFISFIPIYSPLLYSILLYSVVLLDSKDSVGDVWFNTSMRVYSVINMFLLSPSLLSLLSL